MKILALIPARGGSKGVPDKNIKPLGSKPLIVYSIEAALASTKLATTIVSTDNVLIADIAEKAGARTPFIRPQELATDEARSIDVVLHALHSLESQGETFDAVCLLQPTSPFRKNGFIDACIDAFMNQNVDSFISVLPVPTEYNPHWVFEPNEQNVLTIATGEEKIIPRRQELPPAFFRDGSIYITKTSVLVKQQSFFGQSIGYIESDSTFYVNIDTQQDWEYAEKMLAQFNT